MLRRSVATMLAAIFAAAATPSQALVRFDFATASFDTVLGFEAFGPGLGTTARSFSFSDIGGCESEEENRCGGYENSAWKLTLTESGLDYTAALRQDHAMARYVPNSAIAIHGVFRANRAIHARVLETRQVTVPLCNGSCSSTLWSDIAQQQLPDGSWQIDVDLTTAAATREGIQQVSHRFSLALAEVPEPNSWALMIAGFALVGATQRRRRTSPSVD